MIAADQPTGFGGDVTVAVSSRDDGTMLDRSINLHASHIVENRRNFCAKNGIDYQDVVYQRIEYGAEQSYAHIELVGSDHTTAKHADVKADALITTEPGVGLFLPLADCIGLVLYDPSSRILALLHMGRHSTLTDLISRVAQQLQSMGAQLENTIACMTPHASKDSYRMEYFALANNPAWKPFVDERTDGIYLDLAGYNHAALTEAGIAGENIHSSPVDTVTNDNYFSHSAGDVSGRFAVLAVMR